MRQRRPVGAGSSRSMEGSSSKTNGVLHGTQIRIVSIGMSRRGAFDCPRQPETNRAPRFSGCQPYTHHYYLCMSGNSDGSSTNEDEGEWRIIVEKRRSIWQRLRGDGKIAADDRMARIIEEFLSGEPAVRGVTARSKVKCANLDFWEASDTGSYDRVSAWNW